MNRKELDAFVVHHALSRDAIDAALTFARPTAAETRLFLLRAIQLAGVLSLAAGVIFFIAANWSGLAVLGRFALLQSLLVACVTAAWYRPPPSSLGRYALLSAFVLTGALLALFGQSYQTGADVYELFLMWALLALPLVVAAQWSVVWAAWVLIVNVTLWLFCGWIPGRHVIWLLLGGWGFTASSVLLAAMLVNVALWIVTERLQRGRLAAQAPQWLNRFLLACAILLGTWGGMLAILGDRGGLFGYANSGVNSKTLLLFAITVIAIGVYVFRRRQDVFALALLAGSGIALGTVAIGKALGSNDLGIWFLMALWLIVASTLAGKMLMATLRAWRGEQVPGA